MNTGYENESVQIGKTTDRRGNPILEPSKWVSRKPEWEATVERRFLALGGTRCDIICGHADK